jgi:hypothetical protein
MIHPRAANRPTTVIVEMPLSVWIDVLRAFKAGADDAGRVCAISKILQSIDCKAKIQRR